MPPHLIMPPDMALYPIAVVQDRYNGIYSRGAWIAIANCDEDQPERALFMRHAGPWDCDPNAAEFWDDPPPWIAAGTTPDDAIKNLTARM